MHKKLLTMAVAGALAAPCIALAQSSVEVYGTINMAFGKFKYGDGAGARTADGATRTTVGADVSKWDVAQGASNYGLRGRESIGGGLTAWFQIEQNAPMERSSNQAIKPASRNSAVGIQGNFGNVFLGQWTTPWADLDALWGIGTVGFWGPVTSIIGRRETTGTAVQYNCVGGEGTTPGASSFAANIPICDALPGGGGVGHAFWRRASQSVSYQSPVFAGVQVKALYQTDEGKATIGATTADPSLWSASVQWAGLGGRARVGAAIDRHKDFTTPGQTDTGWSIKGGWNFGVADVGLAYEHMGYKCGRIPFAVTNANTGILGTANTRPALCADDGTITAKQWGVALAVPVGQGSIRASYSKAKDLEGPVGTNPAGGATGVHISDTGAKQYNLGYDHRFSKRTTVGVGYAKIDNKNNAQFTWTGAPPNQGGVGNTPLFGSKVTTYFASITHRF
jgi:predicted porin